MGDRHVRITELSNGARGARDALRTKADIRTGPGAIARWAVPMSALGRAALVCALSTLHCASRAKIQSSPNFSGAQLKTQSVLILPIAVSSDFSDDRTGIVLDRDTREEATKLACRSASGIRADVVVTCFDDPILGHSSRLADGIMLQFAHDQPIDNDRLRELAQNTGARFAVLFRPESVTASHRGPSTPPIYNAPVQLPPASTVAQASANTLAVGAASVFLAALDVAGSPSASTTTRGYTLSAALVDLRTIAVVRAGSQSGEASVTVTDKTFRSSDRTTVDVSLLLHDIMKDLLTGLLDAD
jgi:hypothetical protein